MKEVYELVLKLKQKSISIQEFQGKLKLKGAVSLLTDEERESILNLKDKILSFCKQNDSGQESSDAIAIPVVAEADSYELS
ncbi:hypothetical protein ACWGOQ_0023970, partial [Aquimarina sp. M1]